MMKPLNETRLRWEETSSPTTSLADLRRAVKFNGPTSPCLAGYRSVCWKIFLLFKDADVHSRPQRLLAMRNAYSAVRDHHLKYIKFPEQLAALPFDPLVDDPNSPWPEVRKDEIVRAEILQDVQRLPDEPFYHEEWVQAMILDVLFVYCKLNPDVGGYRQGMHELLAPIVYVVAQDALDRSGLEADENVDPVMVDMLDSAFIEHDSFTLFSTVMERAKPFYEIGGGNGSAEQSAIVEKSKYIHEVALMHVDPELATHLQDIEILPQIFLIRWIRLLFGREFPFEQLLVLWDTIFAFDPSLDLIDLVCVAMLLRIRWTLLDADYSVALQLLLKYPSPDPPHGPHTFVDDALYLRDHLNPSGGSTLIMKYTGKAPSPPTATTSRPSTPSFQSFSLRQRTLGARSPLAASARLLQQPGGVEALFQGVSKNVMERGEKLGINQAVRDAMGEIRRNVQGFQDARNAAKGGQTPIDSGKRALMAVSFMERRNKQLAAMLDETITNLKAVVASKSEGDKDLEAVEMAAARVQFVKVYLEDSSLSLPEEDLPAINALSISSPSDIRSPTVALDTTPVVMASSAVETARSALSSPDNDVDPTSPPTSPPMDHSAHLSKPRLADIDDEDAMDTDPPDTPSKPAAKPAESILLPASASEPPAADAAPTAARIRRPDAPIPTRSTLAQSSFAWMLEPDAAPSSAQPPSSSSAFPPTSATRRDGTGKKARAPGSSASRERNAFLFGEVTSDNIGQDGHVRTAVGADDIFGLQPIRRDSEGRKAA